VQSAAGRDLRVSPAVTSSRISQLEEHLGVRLFQRTTRSLTPTEQGKAFYSGACEILDSVENADAYGDLVLDYNSIAEWPERIESYLRTVVGAADWTSPARLLSRPLSIAVVSR